MSKARAFGIIARGCLRFLEANGAGALPVFDAALRIFAEIVEMRAAEEAAESNQRSDFFTTIEGIEERLAKLEKGRPS